MRNLSKLQIQVLLISVVSVVFLLASTLYYLYTKTTVTSDVNINHIVKKDKVYSYSIYSDFYFHIEKYDEDGNSISNFSQIIPTQTDIGYDFTQKKPSLILQSRIKNGAIYLADTNTNEENSLINDLIEFSKEYSKILAVQDQYYFDEVAKNTNKILKKLYNTQQIIQTKSIDNFYEDKIQVPISNMVVKPYKLDIVNANLKKFQSCNAQWCPNIVEWNFAEKDRIYLQYLTNVKVLSLDDYLQSKKKNATIITTTKIVNKKVQKYFFVKPNNTNFVESYIMDENGHIYILKYVANNQVSYKKYLSEYLKISFGIFFTDVKNFTNKFAMKQKAIVMQRQKDIEDLQMLKKEVGDLFKHFKLKDYSLNSDKPWDQYMKYYLENQSVILENIKKKKMLLKASKYRYTCQKNEHLSIHNLLGCRIEDMCNSIECIQTLDVSNRKKIW